MKSVYIYVFYELKFKSVIHNVIKAIAPMAFFMEIYITFVLYTLNFFRLYCEHSSEVAFGCLRQIISFFEDMRKITNQKLVIKLRCFRVMVNQCILISEFPNNKQQRRQTKQEE